MNENDPRIIRRKQYKNLLIIVLVIFVFVVVGIYVGSSGKNEISHSDEASVTEIASPIDKIDSSSIWIQRAENRLADMGGKTDELSTKIFDLEKEREHLLKRDQVQEGKFNSLLDQFAELEERLKQEEHHGMQYEDGEENAAEIQSDIFELVDSEIKTEEGKTEKNYVPAGAFVKAVLIGGLDASAGVTSQANPRPVLMRIIKNGTLPNETYSSLKDCVITGAGIGDISSERAYIRLERMSCKRNNQFLDTPVFGTVFGPDGKDGVRGRAVWREGNLLRRGFIAGLFSGLGKGITESFSTTSISPLGSTKTINNSDIAKSGIASGASNALEKLSNYHIERAEQYQPVIEVGAGVEVDVVFLKGVELVVKGSSARIRE